MAFNSGFKGLTQPTMPAEGVYFWSPYHMILNFSAQRAISFCPQRNEALVPAEKFKFLPFQHPFISWHVWIFALWARDRMKIPSPHPNTVLRLLCAPDYKVQASCRWIRQMDVCGCVDTDRVTMEMRPGPVAARTILTFKDHGAQTVLVSVTL